MVHVGHDMNEKEKNDEVADEAAAAKETHESNEEMSQEDVELRRLIEERRTTPKEEKRLKEVSKQMGQKKNEKTGRESMNTRRLARDKEHPGIKSAKKRVQLTKVRNEKGEVITSRKGIANVFGELYKKNCTTTMYKKKLSKNSERVKMRAASMCTTETRMR